MTQSQETPITLEEWISYVQVLDYMKAPYLHDQRFNQVYSFKYYRTENIYKAIFEGDSDVYALRTADRRIQAILDWLTPERIKVVRLKVKLGVLNG